MSLFLKNRCYNGGNKHNFQARYDEESLIGGFSKLNTTWTPEEIRSLLFKNVYIKDICIWCGKEIKNENTDLSLLY